MKEYTEKPQTDKLIDLGFPLPKGWANEDISNTMIMRVRNNGKEDFNYSIGELISFLPAIIDYENISYTRVIDMETVKYYSWEFEIYYDIWETKSKDLIDSLFEACVDLNERGII